MTEIINHLWQSTAFILFIALAAKALRNNSPRLRYWLWFAASIKFLIPFSLIVSTGTKIQLIPETSLRHAHTVMQISKYFDPASELSAAVSGRAEFPWQPALTSVWLIGVFLLAVRWFWRWWTIHRAVGRATRLPIYKSVPAYSSPALMEPGVFGIFRPVLLLPEGIAEKLTPKQFDAILAHELRHMRCFDNLTAAIHMGIEALFWFHPLIWWIGAKLMDERERDCDEAVLKQGSQPADYARGIVQVCDTYVKAELACISGISSSDLKKRVHEIMTWRSSLPVTLRGKAILVSAAIAAVLVPFSIGVLRAQAEPSVSTFRPAAPQQQSAAPPKLEQSPETPTPPQFAVPYIMLQRAEEPTPGATIKDIMTSSIGPIANYMWDAVATVIDRNGVTNRTPQTDQEWEDLRKRAVTLINATNALTASEIRVAKPGGKPYDPARFLPPEKIQEQIDSNRENWLVRTRELHDAAQKASMALEAKDSETFRRAGANLDNACESCHKDYWYKKTAR